MIVFASRTGNVRYIVKQLGLPSLEMQDGLTVDQPYILFTYTDGLGDTPKRVQSFLNNKENQTNLKGVIASGNTNFGESLFCNTADSISKEYNVPVIRKIDLRGNEEDFKVIKSEYHNIIEGEA